jgi:hypothetical protein
MIPGSVFLLCATTCLICAVMLWRGYQRSGVRLLFWSSLCFACLMLENVMLYLDTNVIHQISLATWRKIPGLVGMSLLLIGLVWESE